MGRLGRMTNTELKEFSKNAMNEINSLIREVDLFSHLRYFEKQLRKLSKLKLNLKEVISDNRSKSRTRPPSVMRLTFAPSSGISNAKTKRSA